MTFKSEIWAKASRDRWVGLAHLVEYAGRRVEKSIAGEVFIGPGQRASGIRLRPVCGNIAEQLVAAAATRKLQCSSGRRGGILQGHGFDSGIDRIRFLWSGGQAIGPRQRTGRVLRSPSAGDTFQCVVSDGTGRQAKRGGRGAGWIIARPFLKYGRVDPIGCSTRMFAQSGQRRLWILIHQVI